MKRTQNYFNQHIESKNEALTTAVISLGVNGCILSFKNANKQIQ